jgi:hypothetical protein
MPTTETAITRTLNLIAKKMRRIGLVEKVSYQIERPQPLTATGPQWAIKMCGEIKGKSVSAVFFIFGDGDYMFENSLHEGPDRVTFERENAGTLAPLIAAYLFAKYFAAPLEKAFDIYFFTFHYAFRFPGGYEAGCRLSATKRLNSPRDGWWYWLEILVTLGEEISRPIFTIRWRTAEEFGGPGSIEGDFETTDKAFRGLLLEILL